MKQGELWLINLDPTIGAEIKKTRPAVVINSDAMGKLPLRVIVPVTEWKQHYTLVPWMINIPPEDTTGLSKESSADCFQVRPVSQIRFAKKIGTVDQGILEKIKEGMKKVLEIR